MKSLNKKGQAQNYLIVVIFLFLFAVTSIMPYFILSNFVTQLSTTSIYNADMDKAATKFLWDIAILDYVAVFLMIVLIVGVGVTSYRLATSPMFFIINFIAGCFYGVISYFFNFLFQQFFGQSVFNAVMVYFPRTTLICSNLHWVMLACIVVGSITLYAKRERGQYV